MVPPAGHHTDGNRPIGGRRVRRSIGVGHRWRVATGSGFRARRLQRRVDAGPCTAHGRHQGFPGGSTRTQFTAPHPHPPSPRRRPDDPFAKALRANHNTLEKEKDTATRARRRRATRRAPGPADLAHAPQPLRALFESAELAVAITGQRQHRDDHHHPCPATTSTPLTEQLVASPTNLHRNGHNSRSDRCRTCPCLGGDSDRFCDGDTSNHTDDVRTAGHGAPSSRTGRG